MTSPVESELYVGSAHALIAETVNLAITEHWPQVIELRKHRGLATEYHQMIGFDDLAARHDEMFSAAIEALAVALRVRLQELGALT